MIPTIVDAILILVVIEAIALVVLYRGTGRGVPPRKLLPTLAAGFFLVVGLRLALAQSGDAAVAACLLGSLAAHLADLATRWRDR